MISLKTHYDAIVVGAVGRLDDQRFVGRKGHGVLIVEKEKFPRYQVGESLMPFCYFPLERLGLIDDLMQSGNPRKYCVNLSVRTDFSPNRFLFLFSTLIILLRLLGRFGVRISTK